MPVDRRVRDWSANRAEEPGRGADRIFSPAYDFRRPSFPPLHEEMGRRDTDGGCFQHGGDPGQIVDGPKARGEVGLEDQR